ncbi:MAG: hypothetical protein NTX44_07250 [Ignavibacteriales bacterium]|nr:hypothetical protein [Ignavibacteriales bacterium]
MKKSLITMLAVFIVSGFALAQQNGKQITVVGEVVESQCYITGLNGPGKGLSHKECALKCAKGGIPLSILEDKTGTLYLTGQSKKAMAGTSELLIPFVAEKVKVTGRLFEKGGMKMLLISKVDKIGEENKKQEEKK